ncbi:MAG: 6-bladed beta-propeller [Tannerella sp.]|jgi:hypothetical protein|nr:6-bladed beta-propeller [Tannerella sp.]
MKHLVFVVFIIIYAGCNIVDNFKIAGGNYTTINARDIVPDDNSTIPLSEFVESIDIIPLEFNDSCILGEIRKIVIHNDHIFLIESRRPKTVYRFDMQGNFLNSIGVYGQGPMEILELQDFSINEEENRIYLLDNAKHAVFCYAFDGEFIEKININQGGTRFEYFDSHFYIYVDHPEKLRLYSLTVLNEKGHLENSYFPSRLYPINIGCNSFTKTKDSLFLYKPMNDTIYTLQETELKYAYFFDFGKYRFRPEEIENIYTEKVKTLDVLLDKERFSGADNLHKVGKWLYFNKIYKLLQYSFLYHTETGELKVASHLWDDIEYMFYGKAFYGQTENALIGLYNIDYIKENIERYERYEREGYISKTVKETQMQKMKQLMRGDIPEDMNPWVLIYHLK